MTQWSEDDGLTDVTASFQGLSQPIAEILDDIHRRGWDVNKISVKDGNFVAEGKNPHGESLEANGRTDATAAGNLLVKIMRREFMRGSALREKLGSWDITSFEYQLPQIAQAYANAPIYEPKAAPAWMELAQDCQRRVETIQAQVEIEYTNDPVPYDTADEMREDVTKKRHIMVTRAYAHHPVWNERQMLDFRTVVDVLGHTVGGADWGWHGTCLAFGALAPMVTDLSQKALFTEMLGQTAFGQMYRNWGPQKIAFLEDLIEKVQKDENKPGHAGIHPSQSIVPGLLPKIKTFTHVSASSLPTQYHDEIDPIGWQGHTVGYPGRWPTVWDGSKLHIGPEGAVHKQLLDNLGLGLGPRRDSVPFYHEGWIGHNPEAQEDESYEQNGQQYGWYGNPPASRLPPEVNDAMLRYHNTFLSPQLQGEGGYGHAQRFGSADGRDPNADWQSGIQPLQDNAFLWQRPNGVDPLDSQSVSDSLRPLDTGIANMHPEMAKQAVVNALRGSIMGSRKNPKSHAIHYQSVMGMPYGVDDPMAYWDSLEQQRENWNQSKGYPPEAHKQHWPQEQQFKQWVKASNPQLDDADVQRAAKRELLHMLTEEEERLVAQDPGEDLNSEQIEWEAYNALQKRLKAMTKPTVDQKVDFGDDHLFHEAAGPPQWLYHHSPMETAESIRAEGLRAQYDQGHGERPGVYLTTNPQADPGTISWAVNVAGLPLETDPTGKSTEPGHSWYISYDDIDPGRISRAPYRYQLHRTDEVPFHEASDQMRPCPLCGGEVKPYLDEPFMACTQCGRTFTPEGPGRDVPPEFEIPDAPPFGHPDDWHGAKTATHHADMYPPYLASSLRSIAQISRHADELADAAREDLLSHKGHGHHFRSEAMKLGIPQLGARQISHAWLHLAPQTSQLGVINPHIMEALGRDHITESSNRDYFKHERELTAGRDASGYSHLPLGAFSAGLYDLKAGGPGYHPDRSAMKPYAPTPHGQIDWAAQSPAQPVWDDPYWWASTAEARDQVGKDFDRSIAVDHARDEVPYQRTSAALSPSGRSPWVTDPQTGQRTTGAPGTSLMQHLKQTYGHGSVQDVWSQEPEYEVGKS